MYDKRVLLMMRDFPCFHFVGSIETYFERDRVASQNEDHVRHWARLVCQGIM